MEGYALCSRQVGFNIKALARKLGILNSYQENLILKKKVWSTNDFLVFNRTFTKKFLFEKETSSVPILGL